MNKFKATSIFYVIAIVVVYSLNKISPGQQDGGLGFGGIAVVLLVLIVLVLVGVNTYKGIRYGSEFFILAGIHLLVLLVLVGKLFL